MNNEKTLEFTKLSSKMFKDSDGVYHIADVEAEEKGRVSWVRFFQCTECKQVKKINSTRFQIGSSCPECYLNKAKAQWKAEQIIKRQQQAVLYANIGKQLTAKVKK